MRMVNAKQELVPRGMQDILMVLVGYESNNNRFMAMGQGGVDGLLL